MNVVVVVCKNCNRTATKELKWIKTFSTDTEETEVLLCVCGGREWVFRERNTTVVTPETLVISKG